MGPDRTPPETGRRPRLGRRQGRREEETIVVAGPFRRAGVGSVRADGVLGRAAFDERAGSGERVAEADAEGAASGPWTEAAVGVAMAGAGAPRRAAAWAKSLGAGRAPLPGEARPGGPETRMSWSGGARILRVMGGDGPGRLVEASRMDRHDGRPSVSHSSNSRSEQMAVPVDTAGSPASSGSASARRPPP